jgi:hypothetical protein
MIDTPNIDILRGVLAEVDALQTTIDTLGKGIKVLSDEVRKHEAGLHRNLTEAVQAAALEAVWAHLGVTNQSECMERLRLEVVPKQ